VVVRSSLNVSPVTDTISSDSFRDGFSFHQYMCCLIIVIGGRCGHILRYESFIPPQLCCGVALVNAVPLSPHDINGAMEMLYIFLTRFSEGLVFFRNAMRYFEMPQAWCRRTFMVYGRLRTFVRYVPRYFIFLMPRKTKKTNIYQPPVQRWAVTLLPHCKNAVW
jgi:hypothetical protein